MSIIVGQNKLGALPDPLRQAVGSAGAANTATCTLGLAPIPGNIMILSAACRSNQVSPPAGWTQIGGDYTSGDSGTFHGRSWYRIVQAGDGQVYVVTTPGSDFPSANLGEYTAVSVAGTTSISNQPNSTAPSFTLTPTGAGPWVEVAGFMGGADGAGNSGPINPGAGWTLASLNGGSGASAFGPFTIQVYKAVIAATPPLLATVSVKWGAAGISLQR